MPDSGIRESDVWGWVDPTTNKEYAVVGQFPNNNVFIIDCSNPASPTIVSTIVAAPGFDVKVWDKYLYLVNGGESGVGKIYDISNPAAPQAKGTMLSGHNIFIAENGYLYKETNGLKIYDLNPAPTIPQLVFNDMTSGGHDATVIGNRLYDFHESFTRIYDVTNPAAPIVLGTINDPSIIYHPGAKENFLNKNYVFDVADKSTK